MPKTIKFTDEHFAKLHKIARAMGPGATPTHAFQSALDDAHAKHYGASDTTEEGDESDPDEGEPDDGEEPAPGEIGADAEGSMLPGLKTVTDPSPGKGRAQRSLAARKANFDAAMRATTEDNDPKAARAAVADAADSVEAASDDLPPEKRGGRPNPLSTTPSIRRWAQGTSAANATAPRPQRRG